MSLSYVKKGTRVEIKSHYDDSPYITSVSTVMEEGRVLLDITRSGGSELRLSENKPYTMRFYSERGVYRYPAVLRGYIKKGIHDCMLFQTSGDGEKIQRRQSYRLSCGETIEIAPIKEVGDEKIYIQGFVRDISGGGVRLLTKEELDASDLLEIRLFFIEEDFWVFGTILAKTKIPAVDAVYEWQYGVEFIGSSNEDIEKIEKYVHDKQQEARAMN